MVDITTSEDCAALVHAFYARALEDEVIGFLFTDVAHLDLDHHLPRITRFWETVLLDKRTYGGGAFRPHLELNQLAPLRRGHFERWLWLWQISVDELFTGPVAEEAKRHAIRVAGAFSDRIEAINVRRPVGASDAAGPAAMSGTAGGTGPVLTVIAAEPARRTGLTVIPPRARS